MDRNNKDQQKDLQEEQENQNTSAENNPIGSSAASARSQDRNDESTGAVGRHYDKVEGEDISDEKTVSDAEDEINEQR